MPDPRQIAFDAIAEMIAIGAQKHRPEDWRAEDIRMHVLKAQRHLATFLLILDGHAPSDGENHLKNALTRAAMALTNYLAGTQVLPVEESHEQNHQAE